MLRRRIEGLVARLPIPSEEEDLGVEQPCTRGRQAINCPENGEGVEGPDKAPSLPRARRVQHIVQVLLPLARRPWCCEGGEVGPG